MSPLRTWQRDIQDADHLAARAQPIPPVPARAKCYACGLGASQWIRSTRMHFSAPRCDGCGDRLVAMFKARGVSDVTVDPIRQTVSV